MRNLKIKNSQYGDGQRLLHQENELDNAPIVPRPVEYEDVDKSMVEFIDKNINLTDSTGNKVPTFKLLSNQRFSEYSQTWHYTDNDGNLFMNFKTVNRESNPQWGSIHGGMTNIPGDNRFTALIREIVDDTGVECYEITSMSQPLSVDLIYTVTFVTSKFERLNDFNVEIIKLFKSKQCYVYPNGHPMPMVLDNIEDESSYDINECKFYIQTVKIKILAYIIPKDDIKVELKPKRHSIKTNIEKYKKTFIDITYDDDDSDDFMLNIRFKPGVTKTSFILDEKAKISFSEKTNANNIIIKINGEKVNKFESFFVDICDEIQIKITQPSFSSSALIFKGTLL